MSAFFLDHAGALDALQRLAADGEEQYTRHLDTRPALPAAAAGRDFTDRGAAVAALLQRIHDTGTTRIDAVRTTAAAGAQQVRVLRGVDEQVADELRGEH